VDTVEANARRMQKSQIVKSLPPGHQSTPKGYRRCANPDWRRNGSLQFLKGGFREVAYDPMVGERNSRRSRGGYPSPRYAHHQLSQAGARTNGGLDSVPYKSDRLGGEHPQMRSLRFRRSTSERASCHYIGIRLQPFPDSQ
jgi:hypothetical protein